MLKNSIHSYIYHQPKDYHFSLDSVFLAQKVASIISEDAQKSNFSVLDLCAGCGVVGLELNFLLPQIKKIDFLEIQYSYYQYFKKNIAQVKFPDGTFNFLNMNYADLLEEKTKNIFYEKYDIILSNPPYFFINEGILSPNKFKNRCRFFIDSNFETLIEAIFFTLKKNGRAYVLFREGTHHGRNSKEELKKIASLFSAVQIIDNIRGTNLVELIK